MPGDPKECRERAAHCLELAASTANDGIKQMFLTLAKHWQTLADELERAKTILDDEKGGLMLAGKKRQRKKSRTARTKRKKKKSAGTLRTKAKRVNGDARWGLW